jgi:sarcosine oxidase/L-pipecolate oxidase
LFSALPTDGQDEESVRQALRAAAGHGWANDPVFSPYYHDTGLIIAASTPEGMKHVLEDEIGSQADDFTKLSTAQDFKDTMPRGVLTGDFTNWKGFYKPKGAGWTHARKALESAYNEAKRLGVTFIAGPHEGKVLNLIHSEGDVRGAKTADDREHLADRVILTAGASAALLLDLENQVRPTAWTLGHIQMTPEEAKLYKNLPVLFNVERGFFMEPDEDMNQLKFCDEHPGYCNWVRDAGAKIPTSVPFAKHQVPLQSERRMRQFLKDVMPHLAERPLVHARICWCADTRDRNFLITYHPRHPSLVVASGDSGMGFMQIPSIGGFISDCLESKLEPRFAKFWRWRPETVPEFWGDDPLDRYGADNKMMDLQAAAAEGWTNIEEADKS